MPPNIGTLYLVTASPVARPSPFHGFREIYAIEDEYETVKKPLDREYEILTKDEDGIAEEYVVPYTDEEKLDILRRRVLERLQLDGYNNFTVYQLVHIPSLQGAH